MARWRDREVERPRELLGKTTVLWSQDLRLHYGTSYWMNDVYTNDIKKDRLVLNGLEHVPIVQQLEPEILSWMVRKLEINVRNYMGLTNVSNPSQS